MVRHQHQHVLLLPEPQQRRLQQRPLRQVERPGGLLLRAAASFLLALRLRESAQVHPLQLHTARG